MRFGAPLPQPVLKVTLVVDMEYYKMMELRLPSAKKVGSVPMKLAADLGGQVTAYNVNKLSLLGLRRKDLLSTAVGLECANKEDAILLGVFIGKVLAEDDGGNTITGQSLVYVLSFCVGRYWCNCGFCHLSFLKLVSSVLVRLRCAEGTGLALVVMRTRSKECFSLLVSVILRVTFHVGAH